MTGPDRRAGAGAARGLRTAAADLPGRPMVPGRLRPVATTVAVLAALVAVVVGVVHAGSSSPDGVDRVLTTALRSVWPHPGGGAYAVDGLVSRFPIAGTLLVLAAVALLTGQRRLSVLALLGPLCVAATTTLAKPLVGRTIHGDNLSYPSGHTGYATAVGLVVGLLLVGLVRPAGRVGAVLLLLVPALATGAFMAVDQVGLDAHYPSDALGGACTALAVVLALALVGDLLLDRLVGRRRPVSG